MCLVKKQPCEHIAVEIKFTKSQTTPTLSLISYLFDHFAERLSQKPTAPHATTNKVDGKLYYTNQNRYQKPL